MKLQRKALMSRMQRCSLTQVLLSWNEGHEICRVRTRMKRVMEEESICLLLVCSKNLPLKQVRERLGAV